MLKNNGSIILIYNMSFLIAEMRYRRFFYKGNRAPRRAPDGDLQHDLKYNLEDYLNVKLKFKHTETTTEITHNVQTFIWTIANVEKTI